MPRLPVPDPGSIPDDVARFLATLPPDPMFTTLAHAVTTIRPLTGLAQALTSCSPPCGPSCPSARSSRSCRSSATTGPSAGCRLSSTCTPPSSTPTNTARAGASADSKERSCLRRAKGRAARAAHGRLHRPRGRGELSGTARRRPPESQAVKAEKRLVQSNQMHYPERTRGDC